MLPLFLDKFDQVEAELKNLRRQIDQLQVKCMTEEFHYAESMKGVLTTKEEFAKLESDLYRSDALNDKRYAELTGKVAELLQKAAAGPPGTQGYDKFVTDMLETKIKKLIAWQQEQYEAQEQDENFKQNQTRFVNRLAQTIDEAQQKLLSHQEVLGTLQDLVKEGTQKQEVFRKEQDADVVRFTKIADQQDHTVRLLKEM